MLVGAVFEMKIGELSVVPACLLSFDLSFFLLSLSGVPSSFVCHAAPIDLTSCLLEHANFQKVCPGTETRL